MNATVTDVTGRRRWSHGHVVMSLCHQSRDFMSFGSNFKFKFILLDRVDQNGFSFQEHMGRMRLVITIRPPVPRAFRAGGRSDGIAPRSV